MSDFFDGAEKRVVVVGGGFSGVAFAIQLIRRAQARVHVSIVEPGQFLGHGLAYSAADPDHRLNGPINSMVIDPEYTDELLEWCQARRIIENDFEAHVPSGHVFLRRSVIGEYLSDQVFRHANDERFGSTIEHIRDVAIDVQKEPNGFLVKTSFCGDQIADMVILATGNPTPGLRKPFSPEHALHPRIIANPLVAGCLDKIPAGARVLVVGSGLTALDQLSTLLRRGHIGKLVAVSRRGLRPHAQSPEIRGIVSPRMPPTPILNKIDGPIPEFIAREPANVRRWCRALRREISSVVRAGGSWYEPFDAVRDVVWKLWPQLPLAEQQRFLRKLRVFWDIHRFRTPPMNDDMVRQAEELGRVQYLTARVIGVTTGAILNPVQVELEVRSGQTDRHEFDFVVNCTGFDSDDTTSRNPVLANLEQRKILRRHGTGMGYQVSDRCEAMDSTGRANPNLRIIGPPTAGTFGDPLGAIYITAQVKRLMPSAIEALGFPVIS
ncbi:MAG: FAD/NAD(P)-binding protein [Rhizobiales bacterium]|nr:FAD/NAD(P)-binding protein [Hyphomicrobiales bacterium]